MTVSAVFYYRNGCHLCEELAALLTRPRKTAETASTVEEETERATAETHGVEFPQEERGELVEV